MEINGSNTHVNVANSNENVNKNKQPVEVSKQSENYKVEKNSNKQLSEKETIKLIEEANNTLVGYNTAAEYSIHEKTHQIMIKIINTETKEIIKEIPSEKILDLVAKFCEMAGLFVDEKI